MHVFVTGATGTVGTQVVAELLAHGHAVRGLARSDRSAQALAAAGAESLRGELADIDALSQGAREADAVISLAFENDFSSEEAIVRSMEAETRAVDVLADTLTGTGKPLVVVSGTPWIDGRPATEDDPAPTDGLVGQRGRTVNDLLSRGSDGLRVSAVRLPRTVHADGQGGFAGLLVDQARALGVSGYPEDGEMRWPGVHAADAAALFRLAMERAPGGTAWHAVADEGDRVRDIAAVIGRRLDLPVRSLPVEDFGPFGPVFALDQPATSRRTRAELGWQPRHASVLEDLENVTP